ncbi:MAG: hypothetical protein GY850_38510 [bacterium]|nr:hypothetical protein [bacterium]
MSKRKNILGGLVKSLLVIIFLIVIVMIFTPGWINLEMVKDNIKKKISTDVGGRITYRKLKLSYFPRPHVVIQKAQISIPDSLTIDIEWMRVYPKILPLFKGSLEFAVVRLDYADCSMKLPQIKEDPVRQPEVIPSFDDTVKAFAKAVRSLPEFKLPELNLRLKNGWVNLVDPFGRIFKLREVQAAYVGSKDKLDLSIQCKSNLWEQISISGSLDPSDFKGAGHIKLSQFRPQTLIAYLFPQSAIRVSQTRANLNIDFTSDGVTSDGAGNIKADVNGSIPNLELISNGEKLAIKGTRIKGALEVDKEMIRATLIEFGADDPKLNLTGMLTYDENLQDIQLSLEASQIDADSVRQAALKLAGQSSIIQILFNVIRGGHVPWMTVRVRGQTIADFGNMDNLVIEGRMTRGKLFIPGADLGLVDVFGDARIAGGVLRGDNLKARLEESHGQDGNIILGLNADLEPFHLNIGVKADLSQLPPVLNRIIPDKNFKDELARIKDLKGTATGTLILGDNLANLGARVAVSETRLTANYNRIPYPIKMEGGQFFYESSRIVVQDFKADIGESSFAHISTTLDWSKTPNFEANTRKSNFDIGQLYSWLLSFETIKKNLRDFSSIKGNIAAQNFNIKGPMFSPQKWHFKTGATINKLLLTSPRLPADLLINRGQFALQGSQIKFADVDAAMGKSSVTEISGNATWKKKLMVSAQSGVSIIYPEDLNPLFYSSNYFSKIFNQFKPLKGNLAFERIKYNGPFSGKPQQQIKFSAEFQQFTLNSKRLPGPLQVNSGQVSWHNNRLNLNDINARLGKSLFSQFAAAFDMNGKAPFKLECKSASLFAGEIYPFLASFEQFQPDLKAFAVTEGTLVLSNVGLEGPVNAPAQWQLAMNATMQSLAINSEALGNPLTINSGSFDVSTENSDKLIRKNIDLKTTKLIWGKNHLILSGQINLSKHDLLLEMDVNADGLAWNQIDALLKYISRKKAQSERRKRKINWLGTIHVKSDSFLRDIYTVRPLEAEIKFKPQKVAIVVHRADICGISFRGLLNWSDQTLDLYFVPTASNYKLVSTLSCLTAQKDLATGTYSLNGEILAKTKAEAITRSLTGKLAFSATEGRIYRFGLLAKLLAILNVTEIYRGEIPDLIGEGFAYRSMSANAKLQGGKIIMEECSIDGVSMGIVCEGEIDLVDKEMDFLILVAPFKTVDRIVEILPLIGNVLGGKLISIPFKAKGDLNDPAVYALPPTAVGSGILGILERTLKLPVTVIQPVISGVKGGTPKPPAVPEDSPR